MNANSVREPSTRNRRHKNTRNLGLLAGILVQAACSSTPDADPVKINPGPAKWLGANDVGITEGTSLENNLNRGASFDFVERAQPERPTLEPDDPAASQSKVEPGTIILNLRNAEAEDAIRQILGDTLGLNFVIEDAPSGTITIQTSTPVNESTAMNLLRSALASQGTGLIRESDYVRVVSNARNSARLRPDFDDNSDDIELGSSSRIIHLDYVAASSMADLLGSFEPVGIETDFDAVRNLLILRSEQEPLDSIAQIVEMFDRDWMAQMSFAARTLTYTSASQIASELETVFGSGIGGPGGELVRFVPIERLNAIITITPQADYLDLAATWIDRLDRGGGQAGQRFYVIPVQNRNAEDVATILRETLSTGEGAVDHAKPSFGTRPGDDLAISETSGMPQAPENGRSLADGRTGSSTGEIRILADPANNTLVALATADQLNLIEEVVSRLDQMPNQVYLETTIAEVTLSDDLSFGLTWFFRSGDFATGFSDIANGAIAQQFPGFSTLFAGEDGRAALSAVASVTDVKVLSSPSLMVLDNSTATLQVGDQVPIVTQSAVSVTDPDAPIVNSVSLRDTGIILSVTPRVNDSGLVLLDIEQEVSDVVATKSSGIDSPTIQQRRISTSVAVHSGTSIALGGLIRERDSLGRTKIPVLGDIPLLGSSLFSTSNTSTERTELIILITPHVVNSSNDTELVLRDLRTRMTAIEDTYFRTPTDGDEETPSLGDDEET